MIYYKSKNGPIIHMDELIRQLDKVKGGSFSKDMELVAQWMEQQAALVREYASEVAQMPRHEIDNSIRLSYPEIGRI